MTEVVKKATIDYKVSLSKYGTLQQRDRAI